MNKFLVITGLAFTFFWGLQSQARNCVTGKACGDTCIPQSSICHIGQGASLSSRVKNKLAGAKSDVKRSARSAKHDTKRETSSVRQCRTGKACGNSCIPSFAACHVDDGKSVNLARRHHRKNRR